MSPKVSAHYKEQRRREILEAAGRVFSRKGFEPTTMKDIVEESGKSFGGVYMYYSNTEDMLQDLILGKDEQVLEAFPDEAMTAWDRIIWMLDTQEKMLEQAGDPLFAVGYEYFITAWRNEERSAQLQERFSEAMEWIAGVIREGVRTGEFAPLHQVEDIVEMMLSALEGIRFNSVHLGTENIHVSKQLQVLRDMLKFVLQVQGDND
ncbi:TetR family transcriptional regulator [Paenibacillus profundus]|uniref:TetR family transcriptional regulator n=1 Tax=Paenibacillus profundus TaxID=1173085 RepID=A0ABS8YGP8_9BACL|nr:TetR family transcriptional regulator [Paenibacillus profundus]MCE5170277.1 TetR family transcriptional regulator [Paenibacillus profundus]